MNSIKSYKALSVVANVEQGSLIKRLIKENKEMKQELKNMKEVCGVRFYCDTCGDEFYTKKWNDYTLKKWSSGFHYIEEGEDGDYYKNEEFECEDCEGIDPSVYN